MNKYYIIGLLLYVSVIITDRFITPVNNIVAVIIDLIAIVFILPGVLKSRR